MTIKNIKKILYTTLLITLPLNGGEIIIDSDLSRKERAEVDRFLEKLDNIKLCGKVKCERVWRDPDTGLIWQNERYTAEEEEAYDNDDNYGKAGNSEYAKRYCRDLTLEGYDDWRLPSIDELKTLIAGTNNKRSHNKYDYYLKEALMANTPSNGTTYWSSTANAYNSSNAWYVRFNNGNAYYDNKDYSLFVRCVR